MPVSKDLFMSILSLEAYKRSYSAGIDPGSNGLGSNIG